MKVRCFALMMLLAFLTFSNAQSTITFVIESSDDQAPLLTASEQILRDTIEQMGIGNIDYLSSYKSISFDFSTSSVVVACGNVFPKGWADTLLNRGVNLILFHNAVHCMDATWRTANVQRFAFSSSDAYLSGYAVGPRYEISTGSTLNSASAIPEWTSLVGTSYKPLFYSQRGSARGGAFCKDFSKLTCWGWDIVKRMIRWGVGSAPVEPSVAPANSVAMIIYDLDDNTPVLNDEERVLSDSLKSLGYTPFYVSSSKAGVSDFSASRFVISGSNAQSYGCADSFLNAGTKAIFLGQAVKAVGFYNSNPGKTETRIDSSAAFFTGYALDAVYSFSDTTYTGPDSKSPWERIGSAYTSPTLNVAYMKEVGNVRGAAVGLRLSGLTGLGWDVVKKAIRWVEDGTVTSGRTVPDNSVVVVLQSPDAHDPEFLPEEEYVVSLLEELGEKEITYISCADVQVTDLTPARVVISPASGIGKNRPDSLIDIGTSVVLIGSAITSMESTWYKNASSEMNLYVKGLGFMKGYTGLRYSTGEGESFRLNSIYPWTQVATSQQYEYLYYRTAEQARGAAFGFCPGNLSPLSRDVLRRMVRYGLGMSPAPAAAVPKGHLAFVKLGIDSLATDLDTTEILLRDSLISMGYSDITFVPSSRVNVTDFRNAKTVINCKYSMNHAAFDSLSASGINLVALGEGIERVGIHSPVTAPVQIDQDIHFFRGIGKEMNYSTGSPVFSYRYAAPSHWNVIGSTDGEPCAFSFEERNRVAVVGVEPTHRTNDYGWEIMRRTVAWSAGEPIVSPATVDPGSVAMVINHPDDTTPVLDSSEYYFVRNLVSLGYDSISFISSFRAEITDLSDALLVGAAKKAISQEKLDTLLTSGKGTLFLGEGLYNIDASWSKVTSANSLRIKDPAEFMEGYPVQGVYRMASGPAVYTTSDIPDWTFFAHDSATSSRHQIFCNHVNGARGAALGFDAQELNAFGQDVVGRMVRWAVGDTVVKPLSIPQGDVAFIIHDMRDTVPYFTTAERKMRDTLTSMGIDNITYLPSTLLEVADLGKARLAVAVSTRLSKDTPDSLVNNGTNLLLLGRAAEAISGDWRTARMSNSLVVDHAVAYLDSPFVANNSYKCASGGHVYPYSANTLPGWTSLGRDASSTTTGSRIALSTERGYARAAALGYLSENLNSMGWNVVKSMVTWTAALPVLVTAPSNGEIIQPGAEYVIRWEAGSGIDSVQIQFSSDSGKTWDMLAQSVPNSGLFEWTVPNISSVNCVVKVTDVKDEEATDERHFSIRTPVDVNVGRAVSVTDFTNLRYSHSALDVSYSLIEDAEVQVNVYSLSGRRVLGFQQYSGSGKRTLSLKLKKPLSKGKYLSVLRLGDVTFVKSFVVW
ncbi:MAG: hypothetical protein ACLFVQ_09030 [Chitinispirillaceae bacterium]